MGGSLNGLCITADFLHTCSWYSAYICCIYLYHSIAPFDFPRFFHSHSKIAYIFKMTKDKTWWDEHSQKPRCSAWFHFRPASWFITVTPQQENFCFETPHHPCPFCLEFTCFPFFLWVIFLAKSKDMPPRIAGTSKLWNRFGCQNANLFFFINPVMNMMC